MTGRLYIILLLAILGVASIVLGAKAVQATGQPIFSINVFRESQPYSDLPISGGDDEQENNELSTDLPRPTATKEIINIPTATSTPIQPKLSNVVYCDRRCSDSFSQQVNGYQGFTDEIWMSFDYQYVERGTTYYREWTVDGRPEVNPFRETVAMTLGFFGAIADVGEGYLSILTMLAYGHGNVPAGILLKIASNVVSFGDTVLTGLSCIAADECYVGSPGQGLPAMLLVNQEIVLTGVEFLAGSIEPTGFVDLAGSAVSIPYDLGRAFGGIPNAMSVGFSLNGPSGFEDMPTIYYIFYP